MARHGIVYRVRNVRNRILQCVFSLWCDCMVSFMGRFSYRIFLFCPLPQWGAADAEIKVTSGENTVLKCSPFKALSRSVYSHTCYAYCQGFLLYFYPSGPFTCIFSQTSPGFFSSFSSQYHSESFVLRTKNPS